MVRSALIASGAYVDAEMQVEFGRLPPAFLPLGNRRLFVHQRALIGSAAERVLLTLPDTFIPDESDARTLAELGIEVVWVPEGLSLGESLLCAIRASGDDTSSMAILHGDTLFEGLDLDVCDGVTVQPTPPAGYGWNHVRLHGEHVSVLPQEAGLGDAALTGFFHFASAVAFAEAIERRGGDFVSALADYGRARRMRVVPAGRWLDFGHVGTYHRSRRSVTTQREFNQLRADRRAVIKSGQPSRKIDAEARWFESLPPALRLFTPAWLGRRGDDAYALEYLHLPTLAEMFVFGRLQRPTWVRIFAACDEFLRACAAHPAPVGTGAASEGLYLSKTLARLESYARTSRIDLDTPCRSDGVWLPSLEGIARACAAAIPPAAPSHLSLVHGDFCFSNVLYDARADVVRVIDPRGIDGADRPSVFGDLRYDIAKLYHSAVGRYDTILAGAYQLRCEGPLHVALELPETAGTSDATAAFLAQRFAGLSVADAAALPITVLLFLSMVPLHADDPRRQRALLANALRLFRLLDEARAQAA